MSALATSGEGLLRDPESVLSIKQLFGTQNPVRENGSLISFTTLDKTWVSIEARGQYEPLGGTSGGLEQHRASLQGVLDSYIFSWSDLKSLPDQFEHGKFLAAAAYHLTQLERLEEKLGESGFPSVLTQEAEDLRQQAEERRDEYYAESIAKLTKGVANDPSEMMIGLELDRRIVAAKLAGFYVAKGAVYVSELGSDGDALMPAVSGLNGKIGRLPKIGVYGVFLEASPKGKKQIAVTKKEVAREEGLSRGK